MNLREEYEKETGNIVFEKVLVYLGDSECDTEDFFDENYVLWLEKKLKESRDD